MGLNGSSVGRPNESIAANGAPTKGAERRPRRLVLLSGEPSSSVEKVLVEYQGTEVSGKRLHAELQRLSDENAGRFVAAEWLGPQGWTRFLWRRK